MRLNSRKRFAFLLILLAGAFLLLNGLISAQEKLVIFDGKVFDLEENALPGASVVLKNIDTGYTYSSLTRTDGTFIISGIEPGRYECSISLSGFATHIRQGMTFHLGARITENFQLEAATLEEEVTVTAEAPLVEVTKSDISSIVGREKVDNLPLRDREFLELAILTGGVSQAASVGALYNDPARASGQPHGGSEFLIDGVSNEWAWFNSVRSSIPADAIQEFRVVVNQFSAEYGNTSGLVMHALTRSGTNEIKGRVSAFWRDEAFDAKNYFAEEKEAFNQWRFGGYLGGPIKKDKAHFFITYEGLRYDAYSVITSPLVPRETVPTSSNRDQFLAKLNYQINEKNMLSFRYTRDWPRTTNEDVGGLNTMDWAVDRAITDDVFQANWTFYPSQRTMNELKMQYARMSNKLTGGDEDAYVIFRPSANMGTNGASPMELYESRLQLSDNFSIFMAKHTVKMGFDFNYIDSWNAHHQLWPGWAYFATDDPFDPLNPDTYPFMFMYNAHQNVKEAMKNTIFGIFLQDTWRIHPRFTLNIGIRYSHYLFDEDFVMANKYNWDPRLGFSWDPVGDGKTVIRGGIGKYTNSPHGQVKFFGVVMQDQYQIRQIWSPGWPDPWQPNPFSPSSTWSDPDVHTYQEGLRPSYSMQYTVGIQREMMENLSISADMVLAPGYKHFLQINQNPIIPGTRTQHIDPTKGNVWQIENSSKSNYKALVLNLKKRYSHGWGVEVAYTLSKAMSDVESEQNRQSTYEDRSVDYGPMDNDARHRLAVSGIADLPLGIQVSMIFFYHSAYPYDIVLGYDANLDGLPRFDRPPGTNRNSGRGYDYYSLDARLSKYISLSDRSRIQVFAEVFNLTNRTNFGTPIGNMRSPLFGESVTAGDPRLIQFGLRLDF